MRQLYLHDDNLSLAVLRLYVHTIILVAGILLVAFALQQLHDVHLFAQEHRHQSLQHAEVCLLAQYSLGGPIEADYPVVLHLSYCFIVFPL